MIVLPPASSRNAARSSSSRRRTPGRWFTSGHRNDPVEVEPREVDTSSQIGRACVVIVERVGEDGEETGEGVGCGSHDIHPAGRAAVGA